MSVKSVFLLLRFTQGGVLDKGISSDYVGRLV